ncbi:MAG: glycosyltransferase [Puniceicoccales bacterium]|jgi:glycosyltransferase involved in cell wall biosynthesis|nr:glycosyltransferase [Puniceicoccales bacterium]
MRVEITIPCHNESHRLEMGFHKLASWLRQHPAHAEHIDLVIANNGSTDSTLEIAHKVAATSPVPCRVRHLDKAGLALALRDSWDSSSADIVGYCDTDMATDIDHLCDVIALFANPATVAVNGSRWLRDSVVGKRSLKRRFCSYLLRLGIRLLTGIRATDIACGFKFFRRSWYAKVSNNLFSEQFFLGGELLFLAQRENPASIAEIPLRWNDQPGSRINIKRAMLSYWHGIRLLPRHRK